MWLKVAFDERKRSVPEDPYTYNIDVEISDEKTAPVDDTWKTFRLSPIFPLIDTKVVPDISNCTIHFFNYKNAYRALGRLEKISTEDFKKKIYFSAGLCSVILFSKEEHDLTKFREIVAITEDAREEWTIVNNRVSIALSFLLIKIKKIFKLRSWITYLFP